MVSKERKIDIKYFIPSETKKLLNGNISDTSFSNFNLFYHKYPKFDSGLKKFTLPEGFKFEKERKCLSYSARIYYNSKKVKLEKVEFCLNTDWRMVIGLGSESVYETSMTLHHVYGFPYIPAQAVKGVIRNYVINEYFFDELDKARNDQKKDIDKLVEKDESFVYIFGSQKQQGKAVFFDALPVTEPIIDSDVMTPHYGDYYSDSKNKVPPADHLSPNPVKFLTVKDTTFVFMIGKKNVIQEDMPKTGKFADKIKGEMSMEFLEEIAFKALSEYGIGAKTSVGYGYMTEKSKKLPEEFLKIVDELKPEEEKKEKKRKVLFTEIDQDFSLFKFRELLREIESEAGANDENLLNRIFEVLINKENYEVLKRFNQHYELINDGFKYLKILEHSSFMDLLAKFKIGFNKIINEFGSKNKKKEWRNIIGE